MNQFAGAVPVVPVPVAGAIEPPVAGAVVVPEGSVVVVAAGGVVLVVVVAGAVVVVAAGVELELLSEQAERASSAAAPAASVKDFIRCLL